MQNYYNHRYNRHRRRPPPIVVQQGQVAFRVVCHASIIGGLIGSSGHIISQIRRDTGCAVHCEDPVKGSNHRIITIVGPASSSSSGTNIPLKPIDGEDQELVSVAQEAVIRVCERMWEVEVENMRKGNRGNGVNDEGYCGLLCDRSQTGAIVGGGGRNVIRMRRESGAQIIVLPPPQCASMDDKLIQITGSMLAVKKALVAVTECLHDCPPYDKDRMSLPRPPKRASNMPFSDPHMEFFPHLISLLPSLNGNSANSHSLSSDASEDPNQDLEVVRHEVSFRLVCSNGAAGTIIGWKGSIVRTLQNETGASIVFGPPLSMSGNRIVTISASEDLESWYSPAQNAIVLVFARSIEHDIEKGRSSGLTEGGTVTARLLVSSDHACCLKGKSGNIDSEMTEISGAEIQILEQDQILEDVSENDVVVEITGEYKKVQNALYMVTGKLRGNLLPIEVLDEGKERSTKGGAVETASIQLHQLSGPSSDQETNLTRGMKQLVVGKASSLGLNSPQKCGGGQTTAIASHENSSTSHSSSQLERFMNFLFPKEVLSETAGNGPKTFESGTELERNSSLPVANTTVELIVPESVIGSVYGKEGSNLDRLRQISGAKVEMGNPTPGKSERTVVISGTPDQTRAAQSVLQAFFIAEE